LRDTVIAFGEILWDLLPTGAVLGGAPFNFVFRVNSLGGRALMISRLGRDELGERARRLVAELGIDPRLIQQDEEHATGTVSVRFDAQGNPDFTIVPDVAYDYIRPGPKLDRAVEEAQVVCFGTLAQRSAVSRQTLWQLLDRFDGPYVLLDLNLRRGCYTPESIRRSVARAGILKLNDAEARVLAGIYGLAGDELPEIARGLLAAPRLQHVVITLGAGGALACSRSGQTVYHPAYRVRPVDTVGCGDAFTAAFLRTLLSGGTTWEALRDGSALGALVATQQGATQPADGQALAAFRESTPLAPPVPELKEFAG
jgi:fructokinase